MKEKDIFEEILEIGNKRGKISYSEINDIVPSEYFSPDEIEDLMNRLNDMGVEVVDEWETDIIEKEGSDLEKKEEREYEETEDIVQTYFHSMGNITILKKDEEIELAKKLEEGKEIIKKIVTSFPLYRKIEANLDGKGEEDLSNSEEDKTDEAIEMSLKALDTLMTKIDLAERKISKQGTLKDLKKLIQEKKKKGINPLQLNATAKEVQNEYRQVESEAGVRIDDLKDRWDRINRARTLINEAKNELTQKVHFKMAYL